jgi:hypothetical protein
MPVPIVYGDTSAIREEKHAQLEAAMKDLAAFVEANMPRVISYGFFLDQKRTQMTVVAVHPDSESLEFHMDEGSAEFRKFAEETVKDRFTSGPWLVGATGFEPATARPPAECATRLRHAP